MVLQFHPEFVIQFTAMISFVTLPWVSVVPKVTGLWITLSRCNQTNPWKVGDKRVLPRPFWVVLTLPLLVLQSHRRSIDLVSLDHGLLRKGGWPLWICLVVFGLNIVKADAPNVLDKLAGASDPEQNVRLSVTSLSASLMTKQVNQKMWNSLLKVLFYTDVVTAQTIKSHHNVGGLPEDMQFELIDYLTLFTKMKFVPSVLSLLIISYGANHSGVQVLPSVYRNHWRKTLWNSSWIRCYPSWRNR